jgi:hypothetical protein
MWFQCLWCWIVQRGGDTCYWCGCEMMQPITEEDRAENGRNDRYTQGFRRV